MPVSLKSKLRKTGDVEGGRGGEGKGAGTGG
jgi:hypothetical protein